MENKIAVVTGAAGGIGSAVARMLAEAGVTVAVVDLDAVRLTELAQKLTADGWAAKAFVTDVTVSAEVRDMVSAVEEQLGPIDFLVNAAGVLRLGDVAQYSDDDWRITFAVNVDGVFRMSREVVERMVPRRRGAIVTVASNAAGTPRTQMAAYAASKAAATMFTKSLGLEVAQYGIRCNLVAPGSTDTPMLTSMWTDDSGRSNTIEGRPDAFRVGIPLRKIATPDDVANAVLFLLSDRASHITLHDLTVDGGAALGV
jgi:2,3-dihydro-2,3-dihydroxybenzoate dehydrogenase